MLSQGDHPYRLRRIDLKYFKSVLEESVELGPMSVVVGANSSGKSTLLQAVLAVAQAVRSASTSAAYPLNGECVSLGTYRETRNFRTPEQSEPIKIGFGIFDRIHALLDLDPTEPTEQLSFYPYPPVATKSDRDKSFQVPVLEVDWSVDLRETPNSHGGFTEIERLSLAVSVVDESDKDRSVLITCQSGLLAGSENTELLAPEPRRRDRAPSQTLVEIRAGETGCITNSRDQGAEVRFDALELAGGVPRAVFTRRPCIDQYARVWWRCWTDVQRKAELQTEGRYEPAEVSRSTRAAVEQAASDVRSVHFKAGNPRGVSEPAMDFHRSRVALDDETQDLIAHGLVGLGESEFGAQLYEELKHEPWIDEDDFVVSESHWVGEILGSVGFLMDELFGPDLKYLGPLRQEPQVKHSRGSTTTDLGGNGEYTAAVLHECVDRMVQVPLPDGRERQVKLGTALNEWLEWFGLADGASAKDHGRHGFELKVRPEGAAHEVDLTSVGVGVSQALPVILVCLLSKAEDLLILEQPELHLHPGLQQRMADFLLSFVRSERQILVETHSEHLVNRLRTQVASDDTDQTRDLIKLLFAEQSEGITSYRESQINEYGGVSEDWPAGFLDLSAKSAQDLVRSSLRKRQQHKSQQFQQD